MKTKLVLKLSIVLVLLLSVVLYKMNDFYRQEKLFQAETQVRKQIIAIKTSVSSQIAAIKNVVSSYDVEIKEGQINWVQLEPFFALARVQKKSDGGFTVLHTVGRSGTLAEKWNNAYLEKALSVHKENSDKSIQARLFKDRAGNKYITLIFNNNNQQQTAVVGSSEYFQKFFDLDRDGRLTSLLVTSSDVLVAHSESDYVASLSDEQKFSAKKYIIEKEEIAGTNLTAVSYTLKKAVAATWVVPWSVVGLVGGFGCILIGLLFYGLDPIEKKVERYKKQEREQIFKDVLQTESAALAASPGLTSAPDKSKPKAAPAEIELVQKARQDSIDRAQQAFAEPTEAATNSTAVAPLKQALANLESVFKQEEITIEKEMTSSLTFSIHYGAFIKTFENILRNAVEAVSEIPAGRKIIVRAYDVDDDRSVIEIQDNGMGLKEGQEKVWQPFFTTKSKSNHMGLGLTESLSNVRRAGGDLTIESLPGAGVLVKMIMKKEKAMTANEAAMTEKTQVAFTEPDLNFNDDVISLSEADFTIEGQNAESTPSVDTPATGDELLDLDLDKVLALDEAESTFVFSSQKINLQSEENSTASAKTFKKPEFKFEKKSYDIDQQFQTRVRRPERS